VGKHRDPDILSFIEWLHEKGVSLGFIVDGEVDIGDGDYDLDLGFRVTDNQHDIITFEIETKNTNTVYKNLNKIFASPSKKVQKPLYHFIIIYKSKLTKGQKEAMSLFLNYNNVFLFENVFNNQDQIKDIENVLISKSIELGIYKEYKYYPDFLEVFDEFNISKIKIIETIKNYDDISILDSSYLEEKIYEGLIPFKNSHLVLYIKKHTVQPECYMLVGSFVDKNICEIMFAYKVNSQIVDDIDIKSPLRIFEDFIERFGVDMIINGSNRAKFILCYRYEKHDGAPKFFQLAPVKKGHDILVVTYLTQIDPKLPFTLNLFSHALDIKKYKEWLYTEKLIDNLDSNFKGIKGRVFKLR